MRVLICGSRDFKDGRRIEGIIKLLPSGSVVIHGAARGADSIAGKIAKEYGFQVISFPADWERYGRAAGPIRNRQMIDEGRPDLVVAFYSNKNKSRGTKNMVDQAKKVNIPVIEEM